jgi:hypothetical protein
MVNVKEQKDGEQCKRIGELHGEAYIVRLSDPFRILNSAQLKCKNSLLSLAPFIYTSIGISGVFPPLHKL